MAVPGDQVVDDQFAVQIVLPVEVGDAVRRLLVLVVAHEEEVVEFTADGLSQVLYFLAAEQPMVGVLFHGQDFAEEAVHVLLGVLDGFDCDVEIELPALAFEVG